MNNMIWRIKLVKPAKKQRSQPTSTSTELPKTVVVSVRTVNESETQNLGKEIENLLASGRTNTATIIKSNSTRIAESNTEQTENEYSPTKKHINTKENNSPLMPMEESVSAVEKKTLSSLPLTTSKVAEEITENQSKTTTSISTSKRLDTQKTDIDSSAQTATFQWVCMDIVRTIKVPYNGKEYDFIELTDGSLVWNENLEPYRKQQKLNVAENVLKYGTGGINIDESRVETTEELNYGTGKKSNVGFKTSPQNNDRPIYDGQGRFPANLIHDNSEEVRECFPESTSGAKKANQENYNHEGKEFVATLGASVNEYQASSGNASRFFKSIVYVPKASKSERNKGCEELEVKQTMGGGGLGLTSDYSRQAASAYGSVKAPANNNHPTVKPIALMEYLIKMVTPVGGIVLDPFAGSGSTLVAAKQNGFQYIGIEMTEEYIPIIEARLKGIKKDNTLF
jgi:hypothetical protein